MESCDKMPSQWKQLYFDVIKRKKLSKQEKKDHFNKLNMSLNNKEAEALKHAQAEKEASWICHFYGSIHDSMPTNSVDLTDSVDEDVSTPTSGILNSTKRPTPKKTGDIVVLVCHTSCFSTIVIYSSVSFR